MKKSCTIRNASLGFTKGGLLPPNGTEQHINHLYISKKKGEFSYELYM